MTANGDFIKRNFGNLSAQRREGKDFFEEVGLLGKFYAQPSISWISFVVSLPVVEQNRNLPGQRSAADDVMRVVKYTADGDEQERQDTSLYRRLFDDVARTEGA